MMSNREIEAQKLAIQAKNNGDTRPLRTIENEFFWKKVDQRNEQIGRDVMEAAKYARGADLPLSALKIPKRP